IEAVWPGEWGGWWGIDLNNVFDEILWGEEYSVRVTIRNRGGAELVIDEIDSDNGFFSIEPDTFNLNPNGSRWVVFTFSAEEVGQQSATIISQSNAWDPREINFRIITAVDPVFRMGSPLPDTIIAEDAQELLLADLDSIFASSDHNLEFSVMSEGISARIARNHELFIRSRANWNGETDVIVLATLGDSSLSDTFNVTVNPTPDRPAPFDLISPYDGDTLWIIREPRQPIFEDSLFIWQSSSDPDEGDTLLYTLRLFEDDVEVATIDSLTDTTYTTDILFELLINDFQWTVTATDGELTRDAWSTFTVRLLGTNVPNSETIPGDFRLSSVYPNPFNSSVTIQVELGRLSPLLISVYDLQGRLIARLADEQLISAGIHRYSWTPTKLVSGEYLIKVESDGGSAVQRVVLMR
ncbi:MAG: T9SS type A sorting domain-containing protein, partial [Candidatus Electryoneaceae bacterium]|nr:T9SS type A sorting domain-containing protein [Candidatus Electryoneaceae bacterium]